jgi:hypothetical protein
MAFAKAFQRINVLKQLLQIMDHMYVCPYENNGIEAVEV